MINFKAIWSKRFFFFGCFMLLFSIAWSQNANKKTRILFLIDASSSMTYSWNKDNTRFDVASNMLLQIVDSIYSINNEIEFAVRSYGTKYPAQEKNCTDTYLEVPFNVQNANQIKTRLKYITPIGFSPIAYSLRQASENELNNASLYDYSIIFITDGGESCNGDVCQTFKDFIEKKIQVKPYVIGLDKNDQLKSFYECMGNYIEVTKAVDIQQAIKVIVDANRPLFNKPKQLNIGTVYSNTPIIKDTETPKIIPSKPNSIFPKLQIISMPKRINEVGLIKPVYAIVKKGKTVILKFEIQDEEKIIPKPVVVVIRDKENIQELFWKKYIALSKSKAIISAKKAPFIENAHAQIKFQVEEEIKPILRDFVMIPKMKIIPIESSTSSKVKLKANTYIAKKGNATLKFTIDDPRQEFIIPSLKMASKNLVHVKPNSIQAKPYIVKQGKSLLKFEIDEPRQTVIIPKLNILEMPLAKSNARNMKGKEYITKATKAILHFEIEERKKDLLSDISIGKYPMRYSYAFRLPQLKPLQRKKETAILKFTIDNPPVIPAKEMNNNDLEYTIETVNNNETMVQVYFKGPSGKAYLKAKPDIEFRDINSKQVITSFAREVSGTEPIPQKVAAGKYNLVVTGYTDLYANNVVIQANKMNKVYINVTDGTLSFAYMGNRNRPVEFNAVVNRRFAAGATILQKCADRLFYEPGTYYVEINTLPASKFSIDLTFGAVYEIQIPEPGTLQISNNTPYGKIQLQSVLGDQYLTFKVVSVNGNLNEQRLILQPGPYKAIIPVDPTNPYSGTKIVEFRIVSNKETLLELR